MPVPSSGWWSRATSGGIRSLADLRGKRVGYRGRHGGTLGEGPPGRPLQVARSAAGWVPGRRCSTPAFLDADFAAWYLHGHPRLELKLVPEYVPRERWNMALAVRAKDAQLLVEINRALAQLAESGELRKIYAESWRAVSSPVHGVDRRKEHPPIRGSASASGESWSSAWTPPTCPIPAPRVSARALTSSWRGPWPSSFTSSCGSNGSTSSTRPRSGELLERRVRPGLRRGRGGQRRRRR